MSNDSCANLHYGFDSATHCFDYLSMDWDDLDDLPLCCLPSWSQDLYWVVPHEHAALAQQSACRPHIPGEMKSVVCRLRGRNPASGKNSSHSEAHGLRRCHRTLADKMWHLPAATARDMVSDIFGMKTLSATALIFLQGVVFLAMHARMHAPNFQISWQTSVKDFGITFSSAPGLSTTGSSLADASTWSS